MLVAAVVLAAGSSTRMRRPKLTLDLDGVPLLQKVLDTLQRTEVDEVVVVLGAHASDLKRKVRFSDETTVVNPDFAEGMSGSIRAGLRAVEGKADAVLIVLGDQPLISTATIDKLIEAHKRTKALAVVPVFGGRRGNPVLFDKELFLEIEAVRGDVGAKSVVDRHPGRVVEVPVDDRGVLVDIDTPEDYSRISQRS
jgi:molybdenum cofactor cytidylyltransferase